MVSEEEHIFLPVLWDVRDFDVLINGLVQFMELLAESLSLMGVLEVLEVMLEIGGLFGVFEVSEGSIVLAWPLGLLEMLELLVDVHKFIFDIFHMGVVDVDTVWSLLDVLLESAEEFVNLLLEILTIFRSHEFSIEFLKITGLLGVGQSLSGVSNSLDWFGVLNGLPDVLNVVELLLNGILTSLIDLNLEEISVVLPVLWNIRDLYVLLESSIEILELSLKLVPLSRLSELVEGMSDFLGLWSLESFLPCDVVFLAPLGFTHFLVGITKILGLLLDGLDTLVIDMDAIWSLLDVLLESLSEFLPVLHESLTFWRLQELLVEGLESLNLLSLTPVFESVSYSLDWLGVLDGLTSLHDIVEFLLDDFLSSWVDLNFEKVSVFLPVLWDIRDMDLLLDGVLELSHLLLECLSLWRVLEVFGSTLNTFSLLVVEGSMPSLLVGLSPLGLEEFLISVSDIIDLVGELIHLVIWEMDTLLGLLKVLLKDSTDISPLLDHLLSEWRLHESLIDLFDVVDLLGVSPFLKSVLEFVDWLGVLDLLEDQLDVVSFALNSLLTLGGDLNLKSVDGIVDSVSRGDTEEKCNGKVLHI